MSITKGLKGIGVRGSKSAFSGVGSLASLYAVSTSAPVRMMTSRRRSIRNGTLDCLTAEPAGEAGADGEEQRFVPDEMAAMSCANDPFEGEARRREAKLVPVTFGVNDLGRRLDVLLLFAVVPPSDTRGPGDLRGFMSACSH